MTSRHSKAWIGTAFAFLALAASGLAQMHPGGGPKVMPVAPGVHPTMQATMQPHPPIVTPLPMTSLGPVQIKNQFVDGVAPGTKVQLARLPKLPPKTLMNTILPRETLHGRHFRPMGASVMHLGAGNRLHPHAASGVTIEFYATSGACTSAGTVGSLYTVGCALQWEAVNLNNFSGTDHYQQYYIPANSATATAAGTSAAPAVGNNGSGAVQTTTLSSSGTWTFGVYDTTTQQWVAVAYANAGNQFSIGVYQDPFHLTQSSQFDVNSSSAAYIYLTGLAPADYFVVYVTRTGDTPNCVFISPNTSPTPIPGPTPTGTAASLLCNPQASAGNQAPNGTLSISWPLNNTYMAGTYSVAVFDCSQACNSGGSGTLLGQTQVSLTGAGGVTVITKPDGTNANPSPNPQPAATANTTFDWDGTTDQSDSGITGTAGSSVPLSSGHSYTWTLTDPQGQVVAIATPTALPGGTTSQSQTFQFASANLGFNQNTAPSLPGQYPSNTWAMQVYDRTTKSVTASQSFKMLGYASQTQFIYPSGTGTPGNSIAITTGGSIVADLRITNTSNTIYPNAGDSFSEVEFSTGPDFNLSNTGNGVVAQLNGCSTAACVGTATDSNGNTWNVNSNCSSTTNNNAECNILFTPASTGVTLTPGSYVTVTAVNWKNTHGASGCGTACQGITAELPVNGLTWSSTTATVAWTPVYFSISAVDAGTASFRVVGSIDCGTGTRHLATPPPFVGTHCYQDRFALSDYQNNSPFSVTNANQSIWAFTITNAAASANSISELGFQQPPLLASQGGISAVDTLSATNWQIATCPTGYGSQYVCISGKGGTPHSIAPSGTETIYLDANWPNQSFAYTDFAILATQIPTAADTFSLTPASGSNTTIDGAYTTLDNLAIGAYSLNSGLMSAYFSPTSVGTGQTTTPLSIVVTNTSTSQDANPDPIDALIIEQSVNKNWTVTGTPTLSATGWQYLNTNNPTGNTLDYWYGLCAGQYVTADGPPATNPTTVQNALPECTLPESSSLGAGQSMTINMNVLNFGSPSSPVTFTLYAHGANSNGWSVAKTFSLIASAESASIAFTKVNTTSYANPTVPTVGSGPNTYVYEVKNTSSGSSSIGTVVITLPGTDINGQNATDSNGNTWTLVAPISSTITLGGTGATGCTVNTSGAATFSASTSGANGQITISGCTGLTPGKTLDVTFQANNPQSQSDTYTFPSTIDGSSTGAGALYLGSNQVQVSFSIGLSLSVDPSNPTNGGAHPVPACAPAQCAFSGTTVDFGSIANNATVTGKDLVASSVIYTGATSANTWSLSVSTNTNPACTGGTCAGTKEMLAEVDSTASGSNANGCGAMTYSNSAAYAIVPISPTTLALATGPENNCAKSYDVIENFKISIGTEAINGVVSTVTYTLIAN